MSLAVLEKIYEIKSKQESRGSIPPLPSTFHFWNGDKYTGECLLVKEKQKLVMDGQGTYSTYDEHIYEGIWSDDALVNDCKITYPDGSVFTGFLDDMVMTGQGKYTFQEGISIKGQFADNRPVGRVFLKDPNGHSWESVSKENDTLLYFRAVHPFWQSLVHRHDVTPQNFYGEADEDIFNDWEDF